MSISFIHFFQKGRRFFIVAAIFTLSLLISKSVLGQDVKVFQAAGPSADSIQSSVDQFRNALGGINNNNNPGPLVSGRREINWDGGGSLATAVGATPFD